MCRAKSDPRGGKICLVHASASKAEKTYTKAKTKASDELIHITLKELSSEGKKKEAPSVDEVTEFLDKETFKTTLDPDLSEVERRKILRNLTKARDEAEMGTTAGAFHAWKNLMHRVVDKMKLLAKPVLAGGTALFLAGCVGGGGIFAPTSDSSTDPSSPDSTTSGSTVCSTLTIDQVDALGDAYPVSIVKDQYGEYCKLTINPNSNVLKHDPDTISPTVFGFGFTEEQAYAAQDAAVKWVVENFLDSSILDGAPPTGITPTEWAITAGGLDPNAWDWNIEKWRKTPAFNGFITPLHRDGKARSITIELSDVYISGYSNDVDQPIYLVVEMSGKSKYAASDTQIKELLTNYDSGTSLEILNDGKDSEFTINWENIRVAYLDGNITAGVGSWAWKNSMVVDGVRIDE